MIQSERLGIEKVDPVYALCSGIQMFFPIINDFTRVGIKIKSINEVHIVLQQALEPNQDVYIQFKVIQLKVPTALTLLVFSLSIATFYIRIMFLAQRVAMSK